MTKFRPQVESLDVRINPDSTPTQSVTLYVTPTDATNLQTILTTDTIINTSSAQAVYHSYLTQDTSQSSNGQNHENFIPIILPREFLILILESQVTQAADTVTAIQAKLATEIKDVFAKIKVLGAAADATIAERTRLESLGMTPAQIAADPGYIKKLQDQADAKADFDAALKNKDASDRDLLKAQAALSALQKKLSDLMAQN